MLLTLVLLPLIGIFLVSADGFNLSGFTSNVKDDLVKSLKSKRIKTIGLTISVINLIVSLVIFMLFDFSSNQFQFVQEYHEISSFHIFLGIDGLSIYFVLLTTIITPIALLSN